MLEIFSLENRQKPIEMLNIKEQLLWAMTKFNLETNPLLKEF